MQKRLDKLLFYLLRSLIYPKRAIVWLFGLFSKVWIRFHEMYRKTAGFWVYKVKFQIKKLLHKIGISWKTEKVDFLGRRGTLQVALFVVAMVIMLPHSQIYTQKAEAVPGRNTLLYKLVGPGDYDFDIEEVTFNIGELAQRKNVRDWKEGAVVLDSQVGVGLQEVVRVPQDISAISLGGTAVNKPTIAPGAKIPDTSTVSSKRSDIVYYEVQPGDVIGAIAEKYGISVVSILWANNLSERSYIRPGDKLAILPVDGVIHKVKSGDNVSKIANLYDAEVENIVAFNKLQGDGRDIVVGEELVIPGGTRPRPVYVAPKQSGSFSSIVAPAPSVLAPAGSGYLWPTTVRRMTQYFGWRHTGVDIGGPVGTPLYASRTGTVIKSQCGWNGGYGCYVIIDHGGGVHTLYGHASRLFVDVGQSVNQGDTIALMGSTGRSTGSHVHFEVRVNNKQQNPLQYIR